MIDVIPDETSSDAGPIIWNSGEQVWEHESSGMRYSPSLDEYYKFITDDENESRVLYYIVDGNTLVLVTEGELFDINKSVLEDVSWDRQFVFAPGSLGFTPDIAPLFSYFIHDIRDVSAACDAVCASTEDA